MRAELVPSYIDYQELVNEVYSVALARGLRFQNPQTVVLPLGGESVFAGGRTPNSLPTELEVLVTVDQLPLPYYRLGTIWLQMLDGDPHYRVFRLSRAAAPADQSWYPLTTAGQVLDPRLRVAESTYIETYVEDYVAANSGGNGGGNGNGNLVRTLQNVGVTTLPRGSPVYTPGTADCAPAVGDAVGKNVIGILIDADIPPGASGQVLVDGSMTATTGEWQAITDMPGGLVRGRKYYLDPVIPGKLRLAVNPTVGPAYLSSVGYALSATEFKLEVQPVVRLL